MDKKTHIGQTLNKYFGTIMSLIIFAIFGILGLVSGSFFLSAIATAFLIIVILITFTQFGEE